MLKSDRSTLAHIPELDGLRGVAILGVLVSHAGAPYMSGGFVGVDVFFVLSGFLITTLLVREFDKTGSISLKNFYIRRALRLAPALLALLLVFCTVSYLALSAEAARRNYGDALISLAYLSNWARAFSIHPPDFLGHTWSLSIEEQFYILWPILLLTALRTASKRCHVAIVAFSLALLSWALRIGLALGGASPERIYNGLDTRADALMVGCTLAIVLGSAVLADATRIKLQRLLVVSAPVSVAILLGIFALSTWRDRWLDYVGFLAVALLTSVLVLDIVLSQRSMVGNFLRMRWLVWTGSVSYGLYLWHYPVYKTMAALGFRGIVVITLGSVATFAVAALSYYCLERPLLSLKQRYPPAAPARRPVLVDVLHSSGRRPQRVAPPAHGALPCAAVFPATSPGSKSMRFRRDST